jgi:hypothetical protein
LPLEPPALADPQDRIVVTIVPVAGLPDTAHCTGQLRKKFSQVHPPVAVNRDTDWQRGNAGVEGERSVRSLKRWR